MDFVRLKTFYCGERHVECEMFFASSQTYLHRNPRRRTGLTTTEKQQLSNIKNSLKRLRRSIKCNFATGIDWYVCLTYTDKFLPEDDEAAVEEVRKFRDRLQAMCKRRGIECRIIIVTERGKKKGRVHHHLFVNSEVPLELIKKAWSKKLVNAKGYPKESIGEVHSSTVPTDVEGLECISAYTLKRPVGAHQWIATRNLKQPEVQVDDNLVSRSEFARLGNGGFDRKGMYLLLCDLYPGYIPVQYECAVIEELNNSPYLTASLELDVASGNDDIDKWCDRYGFAKTSAIPNPVKKKVARSAVDRWIYINTNKIPNLRRIMTGAWRSFMATQVAQFLRDEMTVFQAVREVDKQIASKNNFSKIVLSYISERM